jgi:hypothetical protein
MLRSVAVKRSVIVKLAFKQSACCYTKYLLLKKVLAVKRSAYVGLSCCYEATFAGKHSFWCQTKCLLLNKVIAANRKVCCLQNLPPIGQVICLYTK